MEHPFVPQQSIHPRPTGTSPSTGGVGDPTWTPLWWGLVGVPPGWPTPRWGFHLRGAPMGLPRGSGSRWESHRSRGGPGGVPPAWRPGEPRWGFQHPPGVVSRWGSHWAVAHCRQSRWDSHWVRRPGGVPTELRSTVGGPGGARIPVGSPNGARFLLGPPTRRGAWNLVFNNFVVDDSNSRLLMLPPLQLFSVLPSGLNCLQRGIPCNRFLPICMSSPSIPTYYADSSFGIKCGGSRAITASDGTKYEVDDQNLTVASYYVVDTQKWGVSSVGWFADAPKPEYRWSVFRQFANTLDSELFQTARLSPSSLRYYGLGLQNGNYTVKLQFAETAYPDTPLSWQTPGRRIFDIYIQGRLRDKDFDIRGKAGGSNRAVVENYIAPVTDNFLEIHFFWAGRGTCCTPTQGYYGPAISAISIAPYDFNSTVRNRPLSTSREKTKTGFIVGIAVGIAALCALFILVIFLWRLRRKKMDWDDDEELVGLPLRGDTFSYADLKSATEEFNPRNKLGEGGFGTVFKGILPDGRVVAVKQLSSASHQGKRQFVTEINTISAVQHRNLVKLYGCCFEGDKRLLVYEYLENRSLDQALFGEKKLQLDWSTRFEICLGTARGLAYLHEESRVRIVHRDIKASNILLDLDLVPKISDFGLAKLYDDNKTHISTRVAGTIGYLAPEYAMRGHLTEKADVFAFGVVALEIVSGRPNSDSSLRQEQIYLLEWVC
ncbi:hypothetical protein Taro_034117 [Colocasia esculenta]|uniref:non-specific serine/threonine protein kinase n=1 Tax=Colocasia esculenta TaxID=4460 RepID=A0A843WEI1_COLES|nr:hypothetical protein [Colocasia esculenta]